MDRQDLNNVVSDYIGIPWKWGGYDKSGTFCWGLLWMFQREIFGNEFPKLEMGMRSTLCNDLGMAYEWLTGQPNGVKLRAIDHADAQAGDVLSMHGDMSLNRFRSVHVGCYVSAGEVLHIEENGLSMIEKTKSKRFQWRPITTYRIV